MPDDRNMRERIARALCELEWNGTQLWERKPETFRQRYLEQADAILDELRNPTEAMVKAGRYALEVEKSFSPEHGVSRCFKAMIEEAAKQER